MYFENGPLKGTGAQRRCVVEKDCNPNVVVVSSHLIPGTQRKKEESPGREAQAQQKKNKKETDSFSTNQVRAQNRKVCHVPGLLSSNNPPPPPLLPPRRKKKGDRISKGGKKICKTKPRRKIPNKIPTTGNKFN